MRPPEAHLDIESDVRRRLSQWHRRLLYQRLIHTMAAMAVLVFAAVLLASSSPTLLLLCAVLVLICFGQLLLSHRWRSINSDNFLQHLNRRFKDFEESAQLLTQPEPSLSSLQLLQRQRVLAVYQRNLDQVENWQPALKYRPALSVITGCLLLGLFAEQLRSLPDRFSNMATAPSMNVPLHDAAMGIREVSVLIEPPEYSGLGSVSDNQLDLELLEGSRVQWTLLFDTPGNRYALLLVGDRQLELLPDGNGYMSASATIHKTGLYRIIHVDGDDGQSTGEIHSLKVTLDQPPDIRMLEPVESALEIPKNGPPRFVSKSLVKDDFGIDTVEIIASVAKGSGEAVKFRDQKLSFDQFSTNSKGRLYERNWNLTALGMEPGDEVYFSVIATDNKQPQANSGRSSTLIVRWLDEEKSGLAADGLAIDMIPEFFKSQRQIIIDTEQLIEDQPQLQLAEFKNISFGIGQSQADLKQKYGQYLGDEFAEGAGVQPGIMSEMAEIATDEAATNEDGHHEDDHGNNSSENAQTNINNMADILRLFGHDHGDPEVGPITRQNPLALMKRAVSEMWQAERHLMQSEPDLALPYEYEAYKYLKLARQADRIYVKRLGFEPPPVSEERRLSGELDEILSYQLKEDDHQYDPASQRWNQQLLRKIYHLLSTSSVIKPLSQDERVSLTQLSQLLSSWSQQAPELIRHAASVEKLLLNGSIVLNDCDECLQSLSSTIWNLMDEGGSQVGQRRASWSAADPMIQSYQQALKTNNGNDATSATSRTEQP